VLLGETTVEQLGEAVVAEPLADLDLKGKSDPVRAWELREVQGGRDTAAFSRADGRSPDRRRRARCGRLAPRVGSVGAQASWGDRGC
jgi:hypothetical protein